jgi:Ferritin-like domain
MNHSKLIAPELASVEVKGLTRSAFLVRGTLAAGAVLGTSALGPRVSRALAQSDGGDVDIVNYALTLELLEAAFYAQALKEVPDLGGDLKRLTTELRDNESEHVKALTDTVEQLGGKPAESPEFDFGDAFSSKSAYLKLANTLEDTGVSAYNGAAPQIRSGDVLGAAGSIVQVEARHAALIRLERDKSPAPVPFDKASSMDEVLMAVQPLLGS